jgi:CHAD domain-containing protein
MAKSREITGLNCSRKSLAWVSKVLLTRFDEMAEFRHAAPGFAEIKGVHDIRVATRRLRSALRDIEPFLHEDPLKPVKRELKKISDALGEVRDRDVAIGALKKLSDEAEDDAVKAGIGQLVKEKTGERNAARTELTAVVTAENIDGLRQTIAAALKEALRGRDRISFNDAAARAVAANLDDMLALGPRLYKPFKRNGLHKLRIGAKRLRYSLELLALCRGSDAKFLAKEITRMQDFLGELHDCDIWIDDLGARLIDAPEDDPRPAAKWLLPLFVRKQNKEYLSALALWEEWESNDLAGRIREMIVSVKK